MSKISKREKILIVVVVLVAILYLFVTYVFLPTRTKKETLQKNVESNNETIADLESQKDGEGIIWDKIGPDTPSSAFTRETEKYYEQLTQDRILEVIEDAVPEADGSGEEPLVVGTISFLNSEVPISSEYTYELRQPLGSEELLGTGSEQLTNGTLIVANLKDLYTGVVNLIPVNNASVEDTGGSLLGDQSPATSGSSTTSDALTGTSDVSSGYDTTGTDTTGTGTSATGTAGTTDTTSTGTDTTSTDSGAEIVDTTGNATTGSATTGSATTGSANQATTSTNDMTATSSSGTNAAEQAAQDKFLKKYNKAIIHDVNVDIAASNYESLITFIKEINRQKYKVYVKDVYIGERNKFNKFPVVDFNQEDPYTEAKPVSTSNGTIYKLKGDEEIDASVTLRFVELPILEMFRDTPTSRLESYGETDNTSPFVPYDSFIKPQIIQKQVESVSFLDLLSAISSSSNSTVTPVTPTSGEDTSSTTNDTSNDKSISEWLIKLDQDDDNIISKAEAEEGGIETPVSEKVLPNLYSLMSDGDGDGLAGE